MLKRLLDIIGSAIALIVLCPLFLVIPIMIKAESKGSVIFKQKRIGVNDKEFYMYKFRTMFVGTPEVATDKLTNIHNYITATGYYLRKYSLDELPQLLNILRGEMSFVGPRPALYNQYDLREKRNELGISSIKPGLTGWAQINGRDDISMQQKVSLDLHYLQNQSFRIDLIILFRTAYCVFFGNGVSAITEDAKQIAEKQRIGENIA